MDGGDQDSACDVASERDHDLHAVPLLSGTRTAGYPAHKQTEDIEEIEEEEDVAEEEKEEEEPLPKHPWTIAMVILFANFTYYASFAVLNAVLTDIARDFDTTCVCVHV